MVHEHEDVVGLDAAILMHPTVWKASGHVDAFNDPMIDDKQSKKRYRADQLIEGHIAKLEKKGLKARFERTELNKRSIADALQESATDAGASMLVMGAYGHSRFREFVLGGATRGILDRPRLPVMLSH